MCNGLQGYAPRFCDMYTKESVGIEDNFNVGEFWVDLKWCTSVVWPDRVNAAPRRCRPEPATLLVKSVKRIP